MSLSHGDVHKSNYNNSEKFSPSLTHRTTLQELMLLRFQLVALLITYYTITFKTVNK